jgi:hypothetical protein
MSSWGVLKAAALFTALAASASAATAQTFEQDEWRFVALDVVPPTSFALNYTDRLAVHPDDSEAIMDIVRLTYPTNLSAGAMECEVQLTALQTAVGAVGAASQLLNTGEVGDITPDTFTVTGAFVDELLQVFEDSARWLGPNGYRPIETYARMPEYRRVPIEGGYRVEPTGRTVNLLGCTNSINFLATLNAVDPNAAYPIRIGPRSIALREINPITFQFTAVHEFMHVYQNNISEGIRAGLGGKSAMWVSEAIPDAIALTYIIERNGGYAALMNDPAIQPLDPFVSGLEAGASFRFYMGRPYFISLNASAASLQGRDPNAFYSGFDFSNVPRYRASLYNLLGYETNGFWMHVIERYLGDRSARTTDLYDRLDVTAMDNVTATVDSFLDDHDGPLGGLEHVLPQFLAEYEGWWDDRVNYNGMTEDLWNLLGFDACREIRLDETTTSGSVSIEMAMYSGRCFDVVLSPSLAALSPELDLAAYAPRDRVIADHLYLAFSRLRGADTLGGEPVPPTRTSTGDVTCFDQVEQGRIRSGETCLLDPRQGSIRFLDRNLTVSARTFNVSEISNGGQDELRMRFILTSAPRQMVDVDRNLFSTEIELAATVTVAQMEESPSGAPKRTGTHRAQIGEDNTQYTVQYGLRRTRGPIDPTANGIEPGFATVTDALTGSVSIPGLTGATGNEAVRQSARRMLTVIEETEDDTGVTAGFLLASEIAPGQTGVIDVTGVYSHRDGEVAVQDPDTRSQLTILENQDETLRFSGRVNVCAARLDRLQQSAMRDEAPDVCRAGRRISLALSGAVGFPDIISGNAGFVREHTPALEEYQDLRLARLANRGFLPGRGGPSPTLGDPGGSETGAGNQAAGAGIGGACSAPIYTDASGCNCGCEAQACFTQRQAEDQLIPAELSCRLVCAGAWSRCIP